MAYHGYIKFISEYSTVINKIQNKPVKILEIGVDTGISLFSLNNNLNIQKVPFEYTGVDIKIQNHIPVMQWSFMQVFPKKTKIKLINENSLAYLKDCNEKFDIIMIDGDHNYETVKQELLFLKKISHEHTLVVCDDYLGRHAYTDLYYSERPGYEDNKLATKRQESDKQGVKIAIDEFLNNNDYNCFTLPGLEKCEPICMINKKNNIIKQKSTND